MDKEQELRLGCQHCSAQFHTQWERAEHERRDHLVIVKQDAPNYGFVSTPTGVPPEQLIHIDSTGRYVLNALGQYVGTLVYETADPARRSSTIERLLAERDEARAETENERVHNAELFSRAFAAEAQRDKLKEALKPFAEIATEIQDVLIEKAACLYVERSTDSDGQPDEAQEWRDFDAEC